MNKNDCLESILKCGGCKEINCPECYFNYYANDYSRCYFVKLLGEEVTQKDIHNFCIKYKIHKLKKIFK